MTTDTNSLRWHLMVMALAGELVPFEPARMGPAQYHDRQAMHSALLPLPFSAFWCERPAVRHRAPNWTDR
jgi:hypothetical protein